MIGHFIFLFWLLFRILMILSQMPTIYMGHQWLEQVIIDP